ncbi:MAG: tetratricopeptide repeat protein [Myxococcota bacterium]|nr:tetratricopeptide repeat protein [Myxococcota bacterium]
MTWEWHRVVRRALGALGLICLTAMPGLYTSDTGMSASALEPELPPPRAKKKRPSHSKPSVKGKRGRRGKKGPNPEQLEEARLIKLAKFQKDERDCAGGDLQACLRVATEYNAEPNRMSVTTTDPARANELYRRVCEGGIFQGCFVLGVNLERGRGEPYSHAGVTSAHRRGCELGKDASCIRLATISLEGRGQRPDVAGGLKLLEDRCKVRGSACSELADIYEDGIFVPRDLGRTGEIVAEMCDRGFSLACHRLARMHREGTGIPADLPRSDHLLKQSCEAGNTFGCSLYDRHQERHRRLTLAEQGVAACEQDDLAACVEVGRGLRTLVEHGATGKWAPFPGLYDRALGYLKRACDGGNMAGCAELSESHLWGFGVPVDADRGLALADAACKAGEPKGCAGMGLALMVGHGVAPEPEKGKELLETTCGGGKRLPCGSSSVKALHASLRKRCYHLDLQHRGCEMLRRLDTATCEAGTPSDCATLGESYVRDRGRAFHPETAVALLGKACERGHQGGCMHLAWAQLTQRGVSRDDEGALRLLKRACEGDARTACIRLAMAYDVGLGCPRDAAAARTLWTKGCTGAPSTQFACKDGFEALVGHFLDTCRRGLSNRGCELWRSER